MGSDGLELFASDANHVQIFRKLGFENDWIRANGQHFRLAVFSERHAVLADWQGVLALLKAHFDERVSAVHRRDIELQCPLGLSFFEINEAGPAGPHFMTESRLLESAGALWQVRLFLYNCLGMSALYSGTGFTLGPDGLPTVREYLVPNVLVSQIEGLCLVPLEVTLAELDGAS